jgi:hypothetical protein
MFLDECEDVQLIPRVELFVSILPDLLYDHLGALFALLQSSGEQDLVFIRSSKAISLRKFRSDLAEL